MCGLVASSRLICNTQSVMGKTQSWFIYQKQVQGSSSKATVVASQNLYYPWVIYIGHIWIDFDHGNSPKNQDPDLQLNTPTVHTINDLINGLISPKTTKVISIPSTTHLSHDLFCYGSKLMSHI